VNDSPAPSGQALVGAGTAAGARDRLQWAPGGRRRVLARGGLERRLLANASAPAAPPPQQQQQLGRAYVQGTNQPVVLSAWLRSAQPTSVTLEDLPSGNYSLQARGIDAAGNVGPPSEPWRFVVDATLPLPEEIEAQRKRVLALGLGIGLGVGGLLLLAALLAGAFYWRRAAVARRVERERRAR
ncbi:hypothetical protein MNEG_16519, partial [Monoraphidium neglectum]